MSGLCGVVSLGDRPVDGAVLEAISGALRHRSPRGTIDCVVGGGAVAALRSEPLPGGEPSSGIARTRDGRYLVVADARLDDPEGLEAEIGRAATDAVSESPGGGRAAALILAAWLRWGSACVHTLRGDFAVVFVDLRERRCVAVRDPMAMRPLYYSVEEGDFRFASEIGAILAAGGRDPKVNVSRALRWLCVENAPAGETFFDGVRAVPASGVVQADAHTTVRVATGWRPEDLPELRLARDADYVERFSRLLVDAARRRVGAADHVALLLSGGLDSVATAGAIGQLSGKGGLDGSSQRISPRVEAISYRYEGFPECDEREVSEPLARALGFSIHEVSSEVWRAGELLRADWAIDSPIVGMYRPLQEAAYHRAGSLGARRLFSAMRGDNMVGGYLWDVEGVFRDLGVRAGVRELAGYRSAYETGWRDAVAATLGEAARHRARIAGAGFAESATSPGPMPSSDERARRAPPWLTPEAVASLGPLPAPPRPAVAGAAQRRALAERRRVIFDPFTEEGAVQNERIAARLGIRIEDLWGDRRIVEFVSRVPQHVLNRIDDHKRLTRMAIRGWVPEAVRRSSRKILPAAFGLATLRRREAESLRELTRGMRTARAGWVDEDILHRSVLDFLNGEDFPSALWTALTLEAWMRANELES